MDDDNAYMWAVLLFFGLLFFGLSYGCYQWGKKATYKALVPKLIEMTEQTYGEGYSDGKAQGLLDCQIRKANG